MSDAAAAALLALGLSASAAPAHDGLCRPGAWCGVRVSLEATTAQAEGPVRVALRVDETESFRRVSVRQGAAREFTLPFLAGSEPPEALALQLGDRSASVRIEGRWHFAGGMDRQLMHLDAPASFGLRPAVSAGELESQWLLATPASAWVLHGDIARQRELPRPLARYAGAGGVVIRVRPGATRKERRLGLGTVWTLPAPPDAEFLGALEARPTAAAFPSPPASAPRADFEGLTARFAFLLLAGALLVVAASRQRGARRGLACAGLVALALMPLPGPALQVVAGSVAMRPVPELEETLLRGNYRVLAHRDGEHRLHLHQRFEGLAARGRFGDEPAPWNLRWGSAAQVQLEGYVPGVWGCDAGPGLPLSSGALPGRCEALP